MPKTKAPSPPPPRHIESVYLLSPAGAVTQAAALERAVERLRGLGLRVEVDRHALKRWQRFAGEDHERLAAIQRAAASSCDLVLATRGGYGLTRLLPQLDFPALAAAGKTWCGHSDLTALLLPLAWQQMQDQRQGSGGATSHVAQQGAAYFGPMACFDFGSEKLDDGTWAQFQAVLQGHTAPVQWQARWYLPGSNSHVATHQTTLTQQPAQPTPAAHPAPNATAAPTLTGKLWGGNLSMVCALLGTPYFVRPTRADTLWFFEDINEHPYQIERMLTQLALAGAFKRCRGIVLGEFLDCKLVEHDAGFNLDTVAAWVAQFAGVPVLSGAPFGHGAAKLMLRLGTEAELRPMT